LIATATLPPLQGRHAMAFDRGRQRTLLFAGCRAVWAWDGVTWQSLADDPRLVLRTDCAAAHDPTWGRTLLYGGTSQLPSLPLRAPNPWWFGDLVPAAVQSVGTACGGPSGVPALIADEPYLGNLDFRIDLVGAAAGAPCLFGFALQTGASPLPGGCTLYLTAPWSVLPAVTAANGRAAVRGPVPAAPSLRGATLHAQAMALDPGAPLGVALTAGLRLVVGD
jgi:hypothetical protein